MKITVPHEYAGLFSWLPKTFTRQETEGAVKITCPIAFELKRGETRLKLRDFKRVYDAVEVVDGRKIWKHEKIVFEAARTEKITVRLSKAEKLKLADITGRTGEAPAEYCRNAVLKQLLDDERANEEPNP